MKYIIIVALVLISCKPQQEMNKEDLTGIGYEHEGLTIASQLHDIWALEQIDGSDIVVPEFGKRPTLELHISDMRVVGNAGCNNFMGPIKYVSQDLKRHDVGDIQFGMTASTKMACPALDLEQKYLTTLQATHYFKREGMKLYLYNETRDHSLTFQKID